MILNWFNIGNAEYGIEKTPNQYNIMNGIGKHDMVLGSTKDENGEFEKDWHGLTTGVEELNDESVAPLLFPILERPLFVEIDGIKVSTENSKMLVADLRGLRDLPVDECFVPLHTPKDSYRVIPNREVWNAAKACIADVDGAKIERVFTLEDLTKFGVSIAIGEREIGIKRFNGVIDKTKCQLNVITSHDGKLACQAYDSTIRIVCMNTLRWSLEAAGEVGFKVYHTKNADAAMTNFPKLVNSILSGRFEFKNQMEYFDSIEISKDEALYVALSFLQSLKTGDETSTRNFNSAEEIQNLFLKGQGNYGKTVLDLLNGGTEYYTSGNGTGSKSTNTVKAYKADYGKAADHKNSLVNFLMGDLDEAKEDGRKLYVEFMQMTA